MGKRGPGKRYMYYKLVELNKQKYILVYHITSGCTGEKILKNYRKNEAVVAIVASNIIIRVKNLTRTL